MLNSQSQSNKMMIFDKCKVSRGATNLRCAHTVSSFALKKGDDDRSVAFHKTVHDSTFSIHNGGLRSMARNLSHYRRGPRFLVFSLERSYCIITLHLGHSNTIVTPEAVLCLLSLQCSAVNHIIEITLCRLLSCSFGALEAPDSYIKCCYDLSCRIYRPVLRLLWIVSDWSLTITAGGMGPG